jgi:hypothetical protein
MGDKGNIYKVLTGKHRRKRPLGRPMRRWEGNVKMDLRGMVSEVVDCVHVADFCEHGDEASGSIKWWEFLD